MADPRFFSVSGPCDLDQLAAVAGAEISGVDGSGGKAVFTDVAPLDAAGSGHVSFLDNRRYLDDFKQTKSGACVVHPDMAEHAPAGVALLLTKTPYRGYAKIARTFYPQARLSGVVSDTAFIDPAARLGDGCSVSPGAVISAGAEIGANCLIEPNAVIGPGVILGNDCQIGAGANLVFCIIGEGCIIHSGVRIGQDGFGFALGGEGHLKVPQLGRVMIGDHVEIGANTTIDRGAGPDTIIGSGTKIDNLVQIGHNVVIGNGCIIVSQVGISGSTKIGNFVMMGGQAGVTGHINIGHGAQIAAQSGVMRDVPEKMVVGGAPAVPMRNWLRGVAIIEKMAKQRKKGGKG